jgi:hypothetical protein
VGPKVKEWRGNFLRFMRMAPGVKTGLQASRLANKDGIPTLSSIAALMLR